MKIFGLVLAAALMCACRATTPAPGAEGLRSLARGYQSGITESVSVARNEAEWRALWSRHAAVVVPRPDLPDVDFARDMVVCVTIGSRPTYGYSVEINRIAPEPEHGFVIEVTEKQPAPDAILSQVVTQPFHMVVTPRRDGAGTVLVR
ncbi:MAG: protease complex subunit PrcB family protein [Planctomycetes bacterium]|nr:protease complex subunit PrcB family protein [Planctomycetota bacterium]